jgi:uncharacterized protein YdeI (BOF family)
MNSKFVFVIALIVCFALPLAVMGQEKGQEKKGSGPVSVTGCLNKGAAPDEYVIKDEKGKETVVTGDAKLLAGHANNHQVTITGTMGKEKDKEVLKATDLKMISICK